MIVIAYYQAQYRDAKAIYYEYTPFFDPEQDNSLAPTHLFGSLFEVSRCC
jgi:hypothetical protein